MLTRVEARPGWLDAPGELAEEIRRAFEAGACAVSVPRLGLADADLEKRRAALRDLAQLVGAGPSEAVEVKDVGNQAVGTVPAKPAEGAAPAEGATGGDGPDLEAEHHTDSALVPMPERYFMLYAVRAPRCGGGERFLRDGRVLRDRLAALPGGPAAVRALTDTPLPMRVPKSMRGPGHTDAKGYYLAPVLGERPLWRWRRDKIEAGLAARPEHENAEVRAAIDMVAGLLADSSDDIRLPIPDDAMLLVDNHVTLHGRTAFTDTERLLLRARFGS